jgi:ankyrin repeat protein
MQAAAMGKADIVRMLLAKKANPRARLESGETALKLASMGKSAGHRDAARVLKKAGAR